jgi:signal transduction histidine kinase
MNELLTPEFSEELLKGKIEELSEFINAVPEIYLIIDSERRVVFANKAMYEFFKDRQTLEVIGNRLGHLLNCRHAAESIYGCGTTENCQTCGAFKAIVESLHGKNAVYECRIEQHETGDALDFRVWATTYNYNGNIYSILALSDISDEKRRQALERIFFHDILNTAGGLYGIAQLLNECPDDLDEFKDIIINLSERLIEEINSQKLLLSAEKNELQISTDEINTKKIVEEIASTYTKNYQVKNKKIDIDSKTIEVSIISDRTLLRRVLLNMLKNAVEATPANGTITIGCTNIDYGVEFWVHNPVFIPREIQLQIFKRSFSTKGTGRGLGTYSMKLLSERYLNGQVSFKSDEELGTVFTARYPIEIKRNYNE